MPNLMNTPNGMYIPDREYFGALTSDTCIQRYGSAASECRAGSAKRTRAIKSSNELKNSNSHRPQADDGRMNGAKQMTKLSISRTGAGRIVAAAIATITLTSGSCHADELGPSCKQYLQLKMQCLSAKANTIESNGNAQKARETRRSIPFEMHQVIYYLAKNKEFKSAERMEQGCADDAWYIQNADSPKNYRPQKSVQLCSVTTSWPENYKITPDSDSKVEARIQRMEAEIGISR
ncbi:hypothetical protein [Paraburkholderia sediminicola]|uniref:hypothetical protein n=1 Tax=Paraburkholderia sediminicola TaxID=458836 RepID=UPI0038B93DBB